MRKDLVHPPQRIVETVIAEAITPALRDLRKELKMPFAVQVTVWSPSLSGPRVLVGFEENGHPPEPAGEMRLSFRETFGKGRYLFFGELLLAREVDPGTGYAGFDIQGEAKVSGSHVAVQVSGRTNKYNVWEFKGWA